MSPGWLLRRFCPTRFVATTMEMKCHFFRDQSCGQPVWYRWLSLLCCMGIGRPIWSWCLPIIAHQSDKAWTTGQFVSQWLLQSIGSCTIWVSAWILSIDRLSNIKCAVPTRPITSFLLLSCLVPDCEDRFEYSRFSLGLKVNDPSAVTPVAHLSYSAWSDAFLQCQTVDLAFYIHWYTLNNTPIFGLPPLRAFFNVSISFSAW